MPTWAEKTLVLGIGFIFILIAQRYRKVFYRKLW
jgi:LPS O-antigen subunit length determinant protein (WzzB/FepE family)